MVRQCARAGTVPASFHPPANNLKQGHKIPQQIDVGIPVLPRVFPLSEMRTARYSLGGSGGAALILRAR